MEAAQRAGTSFYELCPQHWKGASHLQLAERTRHGLSDGCFLPLRALWCLRGKPSGPGFPPSPGPIAPR